MSKVVKRLVQCVLDRPEVERVWASDGAPKSEIRVTTVDDLDGITECEHFVVFAQVAGDKYPRWMEFSQQGLTPSAEDLIDFSVGMESIIGRVLDQLIDEEGL